MTKYSFLRIHNNFTIEIIETLLSFVYFSFDSISSLGLYDTDINNIKLLYRQKNKEINCNFINIAINERISIELIDGENIVFTASNDFTEKNC